MQQIQPGIHGTVTDATTGKPMRAMIEIPGHDKDSSQVFSSAETGEFYRLLPAGNYAFTITSPGYKSQTNEFSLAANETLKMTLSLLPSDREFSCYPNPFTNTLAFILPDESKNDLYLILSDLTGRIILRQTLPGIQGYASINGLGGLARGAYLVEIRYGSLVREMKVVK